MAPDDIHDWFAFHPADTAGKQLAHTSVRDRCGELARFLNDLLPEGGEKNEAITNLEQTMFWANAAVARPQRGGPKAVSA